MAAPIHNPGTPYVGPIPGGVHDGTQIHVSGTAEHHHTGFLISLQNGPSIDPRNDCPFVFNPRFNENAVIRNSLNHGSWGTEERHGGFPFHKGQHFEVTIQIKDHHYKVLVNNRHFCDYNHRMPKHMCTYLTVEEGIRIYQIRFDNGYPLPDDRIIDLSKVKDVADDVLVNNRHFCDYNHRMPKHMCTYLTVEQGIRINQIRFDNGRHHHGGIAGALGHFAGAVLGELTKPHHHPPPPSTGPNYPGGAGYPGPGGGYPGPAGPVYNPPVPFVHNMPGGLYPNKMIYISGIPNPNPSRFTVYLQHGPHHEPKLISLCFDARFNYGNDRGVVVRNSCQQGAWGNEERHCQYFPFMPNTNFDMMILVEPNQFKVAVNNQHLLEFYHRVHQLQRVDTLRIDGDVRLTQVRFQ